MRELLQKKGGRLLERQARKIVKQIATAFDYLYSEEIIHRDMKPENIMIHFPNRPTNWTGDLAKIDLDTEEYICKVGDFGLARKLEH